MLSIFSLQLIFFVSFLHVIALSEVLKATNATRNEISQLEEAQKDQGSRYLGRYYNCILQIKVSDPSFHD